MKIYTFKNINDASIKIKNKIVNVDGYYTFRYGIILNTAFMSYSNINNSVYKSFIQVCYNNNDNSYAIITQGIITSDSGGYNFVMYNVNVDIIIYYI